MPTIDPMWQFIIALTVNVAIGVTTGALVLTNAIPADLIKPATAWCGIIAFVGSSATSILTGMGMSNQSRLASAAAIPEVKTIVTTKAIADATPSDKVVSQ